MTFPEWVPWVVGGSFAGSGLIALGVFHPRVALFGPETSRVRTAKPQVALTFDDGPHPEFTPKVLELLQKHGDRATFFCVGEEAERHPELVRQLVAQGHELGNHTFSHDTGRHLFLSPLIAEDVKRCQATLSALGPAPRWYRPAVGIRNPPVHYAARVNGLKVITWSLAARDGARALTEAKALELAERARPGDVITLHDGVRGKNGAWRAQTLQHLPKLLERLHQRGLSSVTVTALSSD